MIYEIHPTERGNDAAGFKVWNVPAQQYVLQLSDGPQGRGMTLLIGLTFQNLRQQDERRADDFMTGVVYGIQHCIIAGTPVIGHITEPK